MKKCILFAGAVGCSKIPVAVYLSHSLGLSVFNNDAIRSEVIEDLGILDEKEFRKRAFGRIKAMVAKDMSFILDASIDREYKEVFKAIKENDYEYYLISFDLSEEFLSELYKSKGYEEYLKRIDEYVNDHDDFLEENPSSVDLVINDDNFMDRLNISLEAAKEFFT